MANKFEITESSVSVGAAIVTTQISYSGDDTQSILKNAQRYTEDMLRHYSYGHVASGCSVSAGAGTSVDVSAGKLVIAGRTLVLSSTQNVTVSDSGLNYIYVELNNYSESSTRDPRNEDFTIHASGSYTPSYGRLLLATAVLSGTTVTDVSNIRHAPDFSASNIYPSLDTPVKIYNHYGYNISSFSSGTTQNFSDNYYMSGNLTVSGSSSLKGNTSITGTMSVSSDTTIGGSLSVTGTSSIGSNTTISGNLDVNGASNISGNTIVGGTFTSSGAATFQSTVDISGNTSVGGNLSTTGNFSVNTNKFTVDAATGDTNLTGDLTVSGNITVDGAVDGVDISSHAANSSAHHTRYSLTEDLDTNEISQLQNINTTTISSTQWGYLGSLDQNVSSSSNVTFSSITCDDIIINNGKYISIPLYNGFRNQSDWSYYSSETGADYLQCGNDGSIDVCYVYINLPNTTSSINILAYLQVTGETGDDGKITIYLQEKQGTGNWSSLLSSSDTITLSSTGTESTTTLLTLNGIESVITSEFDSHTTIPQYRLKIVKSIVTSSSQSVFAKIYAITLLYK